MNEPQSAEQLQSAVPEHDTGRDDAIVLGPLVPFERAFDRYLEALDRTWSETLTACDAAHRRYAEALGGQQVDITGGEDDVFRRYVGELRAAWTTSQGEYGKAYRAFVDEMRAAWDDADADELGPAHLDCIGRACIEAARFASLTVRNWEPFVALGVSPTLVPFIRAA